MALGLILAKNEYSNAEDIVVSSLARRRHTLSVAESVSGGNLAACLSSVPGASSVFMGGIIVYSALAKAVLAGLDMAYIVKHGTVSEAVTSNLAIAIRKRLHTDWSLAITGNAGPTKDKGSLVPVGVCFVAVAGPCGIECTAAQFYGNRIEIQKSSVLFALDMLRCSFMTCI